MNFLAHLYLSADSPEALVGNLVADFIKGPDLSALPAGIQEGIRHHRRVDAFTDRHPVVQRSITRISDRWGWFSGIAIDIYYDHILAMTWDRYSPAPLRAFADRVHQAIRSHNADLPPVAGDYILRLIETDRLISYAAPDGSGVADALYWVSKRIAERMPTRAVRLDESLPDLRAAHTALSADFHEFFPHLVAFAGANVAGMRIVESSGDAA